MEKDKGDTAVGLLLPVFGNEMLVLPQCEENLGVQADVVGFLEALEFFLVRDVTLTFLETSDQLDPSRCSSHYREIRWG